MISAGYFYDLNTVFYPLHMVKLYWFSVKTNWCFSFGHSCKVII